MNTAKADRRAAPLVERWCNEFVALCRSRRVRVTAQRLAVYRALAEVTNHPTAEAVYARLRPEMPSLSQATVYRILDSFERKALIRRVSTTDGVSRFDANLAPHQHLVCRVCGRMTDFPAPAPPGSALEALKIPGFEVEELDIRIVGRCRKCRGGNGRAESARGRKTR